MNAEQLREWRDAAEHLQSLTIVPKAYDLNTRYSVSAVAGASIDFDTAMTKAIAFVGSIANVAIAVPALIAEVERLTGALHDDAATKLGDAMLDASRLRNQLAAVTAERDALAAELAGVKRELNALQIACDIAAPNVAQLFRERDVLTAQLKQVLTEVDAYSVYCYDAHTDGRWRMSFAEWQQAIKNDAQPQA